MTALTAQWVASAVGGVLAADADAQITSVEKDSRIVQPGALFAAFVGEHVDGHDMVGQAIGNGATLALVQRPVDAPHVLVEDVTTALGSLARAYLARLRTDGEINVIGITGSNGKTTTKDLLAQILPNAVAPVGSFNNEIGLPLTVLSADQATEHLVLEMGASAPGDIAHLTSIAPLDVAVVLTVGSAHAGGYTTADGVAAEKATLLDAVVPGGTIVLNADDAVVAKMRHRPGATEQDRTVVTFGTGRHADVTAHDITTSHGRASFTVSAPTGEAELTLTLVGEHHVTNALAALTAATVSGLDLDVAAPRLSSARALSAHRMALTERSDGVWILDDAYNASPESMRAALRALKDVAGTGRAIAVIGQMREMGDASVAAHASVGVEAVRLRIDHLLVVGEEARAAYTSAVREGSWGDEASFAATIDEAHTELNERLRPGDTVLIKASHGAGLWKLADDLLGEDA